MNQEPQNGMPSDMVGFFAKHVSRKRKSDTDPSELEKQQNGTNKRIKADDEDPTILSTSSNQ